MSDQNYDAREVINENDENIHDKIEMEVQSKIRRIEDLPPDLLK